MAEPLSLISSLASFSPTPLAGAGAAPTTSAFPKSRVVAVFVSHKCLPLRSFPSPSSLFLHKRRSAIHASNTNFSSLSPKCFASDPAQLKGARDDIKELLRTKFCHPILVRLGWHDAGTYDKSIEDWPQRGGANGSLRFEVELKHAANAGLVNALTLIQPIKDKYPGITYADLFQLASATAIEFDRVCEIRHHRMWDLDPRVAPYVASMGFYAWTMVQNMRLDHALITALVERWRSETHTFHFWGGEMTVTLQDVALLTGLPVDGHPVTGNEFCDDWGRWESPARPGTHQVRSLWPKNLTCSL